MSRIRRQAIAVGVFLIVVTFFFLTFRMAVVHGDSMLPTFRDGQIVLVSKLNGSLSRGDVVLVDMGSEVLIKRIAYLPGEIIEEPESYAFEEVWFKFERPDSVPNDSRLRLKVPAGHYVILGDNAAVSDDSRKFGPIPARKVLGKVVNAPPPPQP